MKSEQLVTDFDVSIKLINSGIKDWISMFAESFFIGVAENHIEEIKNEVQEKVKEQCLINGKWFADYKRIRIAAIKEITFANNA